MKKLLLALSLTISTLGFCLSPTPPKLLWKGETASWQDINAANGIFATLMGNALFPTILSNMAQTRLTTMFGQARSADPIRWAAFESGNRIEIVIVYPSVDKEARMVLHHPGAMKHQSIPGVVRLPKDEGRPSVTWAVFNRERTYCAFSRNQGLAEMAIKLDYPKVDGGLCAFTSSKAYARFGFDASNNLEVSVRADNPDDLAGLKVIPVVGTLFSAEGQRNVSAEDFKSFVIALGKLIQGER